MQITVETYAKVMEQEGEQGMQSESEITTAAPLRQLTTPPMIDAAKEIIRQHSCEVVEYPDHCMGTFPEGTIRTELLPRLRDERFEITLPDGFQLIELCDRWRERSLLFLLL